MFNPPEHLINQWPEVFTDLEMKTLPVAYIDHVRLDFSDGSVWEIDINSQLLSEDPEIISKKLLETLEDYQDIIVKIDFSMDIERLINDVKQETKKIF